MESTSLTLAELNNHIRDILEANFPDQIWLIAEISELNINTKGHCYIDFIERDELTKKIVARQRATIWAFQYRLISGHFESIARQPLSSGMKVLVNVQVKYHVLYGLSLNVVDIDPSYTLGEQARHREAVIKQLEEEGVLEMNKGLHLVDVPQRIAIISSETAAGFGDFINHLEQNPYGYSFKMELFQSFMQGENTSNSIIKALGQIYDLEDEFDAILIIRGGGAKAELSAFDDYDLSFMISQSPIPVLTGIGHERDESVADLVAWQAFKTPTAVADFLIERMANFDYLMDEMTRKMNLLINATLDKAGSTLEKHELQIGSMSKALLQDEVYALTRLSSKLGYGLKGFMRTQYNKLDHLSGDIKNKSKWFFNSQELKYKNYHKSLEQAKSRFFVNHHHKLELFEARVLSNDPKKLLKSGYGFITLKGKRISSVSELNIDDDIRIAFKDGQAKARVNEIKSNKED